MAKKRTIIVVDDTESILEAMREILSLEGYTVLTAENEDIMLEHIKKVVPDLIMLDVLLSGQDGRVIARKLKDDKQTKGVPILMMSAHPDVAKTVKKSGADVFIPKPFQIKDLLATIEKLLT